MKLEQLEQKLRQRYEKVAHFGKDHRAIVLTAFTIIGVAVIVGLYRFISPSTAEDPSQVKQGFALVLALSLGGIAALIGLYFTRKTLHTTRQLEADRARDSALRACLKQLGDVLTHEEWGTATQEDTQEGSIQNTSSKGETLRHVARAQALSVLGGLDGPRKRILVRFLYESRLIDNEPAPMVVDKEPPPLVDLYGADLRDAYLYRSALPNAYLGGARLTGADLRGTDLTDANLSDCDLRGVDLREAYRSDGTPIPTNLSRADLSKANLSGAWLVGADLRGTDLTDANLSDCDLSNANLYGARVTQSQLEATRTLEGATMPDDDSTNN